MHACYTNPDDRITIIKWLKKNGSPGDKYVIQLQVCHVIYFWPDKTFHNFPIHNCRNQCQITFKQSENTKIKNTCDTHDHKKCNVKNATPKNSRQYKR